jgi:glyoxylase-like metal-dependent hydrolase (beta-lactamase superfamily II)
MMKPWSRRAALIGCSCAAVPVVLSVSAVRSQAPGAVIGQMDTAPTTIAFGDAKAQVFSDGHMMVGLDRLSARAADDPAVRRALLAVGLAGTQHRFALNITLLELLGQRILIDAGAGETWVETGGKLADALTQGGIDAASISLVVLTHAHPDHLWGVIDSFDGSLRFPSARYAIPDAEFAFWMSPTAPEAAGAAEGMTAGARRILKLIEPKLTRYKADSDIQAGLTYVDAKGHTPGQCAVLASSGGEHILVAADTIFHPVISVEHPDWQPAQDLDGAAAAASRGALLALAASTQARVVAYHVAGPGFGRIAKSGPGYVWRDA